MTDTTESADAPKARPENPRLEILAEDRVAIVKGEARAELRGANVPVIIWWRRHLQEPGHPPGAADWHLAGLIHGLQYSADKQAQELLDDARRNRQAQEVLDDARRRREQIQRELDAINARSKARKSDNDG